MSETVFATVPVAAHGGVLLLAALAFWIRVRVIVACQPKESLLVRAIGRDTKGNVSVVLYLIAIPLTLRTHGSLSVCSRWSL
jgi:hypothetical protein